MRSMGIYGRFLSEQDNDAIFSVARLPMGISVGRDDIGNVCYQLKKICFCAEWIGSVFVDAYIACHTTNEVMPNS